MAAVGELEREVGRRRERLREVEGGSMKLNKAWHVEIVVEEMRSRR
uniref:Uncharacterized protein n=1 Tax=Arundo donax TaxID=35708 RepID=A0A0A9B249_ARUDO